MNCDIYALQKELSVANSAKQASDIADEIEQKQRLREYTNMQKAKVDETLFAGAEANIQQKQLFEQQIEILGEQNRLLFDNYSKLKEMFNAQVETNKEEKEELKRSKRFNIVLMFFSFISMIAAIAGPIATILVSK